ncbi:MAG TPA: FtsW/RodA/SpoVE family cell cycle protein, partial [Thermoanaerobacterales bacterium]|nr:FtsW/RodA/SpoVE family cell cycle protein [Thermoanaerobacterales bacterium]
MDRKLLKNVEYPILITIILITILSVLIISSATHATSSEGSFRTARMQIFWFGVGLVAMILMVSIDYHSFAHWSNIIYIVNILALLLVIFKGEEGGGAQRWLDIGPFRLQPSEFAKLAIIITLARHLEKKKSLNSLQDLLSVFMHMAVPMLLIAKQPDLGTSLVLLAIVFGVMFIAGLSYKLLTGIIGAGVLSLPVMWNFLKPYQKDRILV